MSPSVLRAQRLRGGGENEEAAAEAEEAAPAPAPAAPAATNRDIARWTAGGAAIVAAAAAMFPETTGAIVRAVVPAVKKVVRDTSYELVESCACELRKRAREDREDEDEDEDERPPRQLRLQ